MSSVSVNHNTRLYPVYKEYEKKLASELFFTDLNTTATCQLCGTKVLYREFNMKKHYTAKHAGQNHDYSREKQESASTQPHAEFNCDKETPVKHKPEQNQPGT